MEQFDRIFTKVSEQMAFWVGGLLLLGMMLWVCTNVFARYVLDIGGVPGMFEYVGVFVVPLICLSLSYGWHTGSYIVINILQKKLKGRTLWGFQFAFTLCTLLLFSGILCVGGFLGIITAIDFQREIAYSTLASPQWPWNVTLFVGFLFFVIRNLLDLIKMVRTGEVLARDRSGSSS